MCCRCMLSICFLLCRHVGMTGGDGPADEWECCSSGRGRLPVRICKNTKKNRFSNFFSQKCPCGVPMCQRSSTTLPVFRFGTVGAAGVV